MKTILIASVLLMTFTSHAARECIGFMSVPSYSCINPDPGADLRLSVTEFQTCEDGRIIDLDRTVSLMRFDGPEIIIVDEKDVNVTFEAERSYYNRAERADDLTFVLPTRVEARYADKQVELNLPNKLQPIFRGSFEKHMPGTFVIKNAEGKVLRSGRLSCSVHP